MGHVLREILAPFLENRDLLEAMFVGARLSHPTHNPGDSTSANAEGSCKTTVGAAADVSKAETLKATAEEGRGKSVEERQPSSGAGPWGYSSSFSSRGCWKVDARAAAQRDSSVELNFDSVAFDVFLRPEDWKGAREEEEGARWSQSATAHAVVSNAVPFHHADGLPRELGPLLFDETADASLLAGTAEPRPPSRGARGEDVKHPAAVMQEGGKEEFESGEGQHGEEGDNDLWVKKENPRSYGPVLTHVHGRTQPSEGTVEVRLRGEPMDATQLARAGMPQDMSALVVDAIPDVNTMGSSLLSRGVAASALGGSRQGVQKSRAAAH